MKKVKYLSLKHYHILLILNHLMNSVGLTVSFRLFRISGTTESKDFKVNEYHRIPLAQLPSSRLVNLIGKIEVPASLEPWGLRTLYHALQVNEILNSDSLWEHLSGLASQVEHQFVSIRYSSVQRFSWSWLYS